MCGEILYELLRHLLIVEVAAVLALSSGDLISGNLDLKIFRHMQEAAPRLF